MSLNQWVQLAQSLQLSPALLQSMQILQMNTLELADYLNNLALENPTMEPEEGAGSTLSWEEFSSRVSWLSDTPSHTGDTGLAQAAAEDPTDTLDRFLADQLSRLPLAPPLLALCRYLAESLDDHGRLDPSDLTDLAKTGVPQTLLDRAVSTLQSLEPAGVAARSTGECLALQLARLPGDHSLAIRLCRDHLNQLAKGNRKALAAKLSVSPDDIEDALRIIQAQNPNPVGGLAPSAPVSYLRPDAWVAEIDGDLRVFVNQWDLPHFTPSQPYLTLAREGSDQEATHYLLAKFRQARWVLQCVQRRQSTLENSLSALVCAQEAFFGGRTVAPVPLLRRELAETLQIHPSTVTRTLRHKVIQCRQGLFPTDYFFSRRSGGIAPASAQAIRVRMEQLIREEPPRHPYSDQAITDLLSGEGICLARRTVAKYRQALGLPPAHLRRR